MHVTIEPMQVCHLERVVAIEREVYPSPWSKNAFVNEIMDNGLASYWVAMIEEQVVGYAGIWTIMDEAHLTTLAVCRRWQRRGVGSLLLDRLLVEAKALGATRITLEVRVSNDKAQKLYKKYGFMSSGLRPNYYHDEDALVMWLDNLLP
ncbi:MAG: ribosomal protein S18-alanine N-acetyltransferase [Dethiobacter sp.]|nr:ribosomal protein S18-alanine N-acetyltransferase [Dethiobacter sp.]MBS3901585.1 ribosomal protein S18-alanine N-acetyltransferase [Dethiobacter sp.]MBS3988879.1 ribosomal protein S18-alanine N-acetyltransferase [Dethiobacter sp.]